MMQMTYAGLANWKTTIVGALLAALLIVQEGLDNGVQITDTQLWVAVGIAVLGFLARDANKSSRDSGI